MITDQGQRARMISYIESHAPARSRDLAAMGLAATAISRAVADGAVVRIGRITSKLARLTKAYKTEGGGFHAWDEGEIARTFEGHAPGTMAHRAVTRMLYKGAARVDAVTLGSMNIKRDSAKEDRLEYRRKKTIKSNGVLVRIPIHPDLVAVPTELPDDRPYLVTVFGKSRPPDGRDARCAKGVTKRACANVLPMVCASHVRGDRPRQGQILVKSRQSLATKHYPRLSITPAMPSATGWRILPSPNGFPGQIGNRPW